MIIGVGSNRSQIPVWQSPDLPAPTITTSEQKPGASGWLLVDRCAEGESEKMDKPPYRVPSMPEIAAVPWNGFTAISTFSGCGGSSLGYKMAGFRVAWANEFVPVAQEVYRLNHPDTILDTRDIRLIQPQEILDACGLKVGELDLLDGSPPCASFSTAGKREAGWGKVKAYSDTKQRTDDLFFEYARLVRGLQPKVFVAENVSGLIKGTAKGYFLEILAALKDCGYAVKAKLLDAQWLGVPQMRQRVIFVGVRADLAALGIEPAHPSPLPYRYSVRDALPWILQHGTAPPHKEFVETNRSIESTLVSSDSGPSPTITTGENKGTGYVVSMRAIHDTGGQFSKGDITLVPSPTVTAQGVGQFYVEAETDISRYAIGAEWEKLRPGEQSEKYFSLVKPDIDGPTPTIQASHGGQSIASVTHPTEKRKFSIAELKRICAFPDDFQLTGTYAQQWERLGRAVPPVMMAAVARTIQAEILDRCAE